MMPEALVMGTHGVLVSALMLDKYLLRNPTWEGTRCKSLKTPTANVLTMSE